MIPMMDEAELKVMIRTIYAKAGILAVIRVLLEIVSCLAIILGVLADEISQEHKL